jgi:transposase
MAGKVKPMSIVKQILLQAYQGKSRKSITRSVGVSINTVRRYLQLAQGSGHKLDELIKMDDPMLEKILHRSVTISKSHYEELEEMFPTMRKELKETGVTRFLLWGEYRRRYPDGYSYSQYCWYYQQWLKAQEASMILEHEPGDKVFVDFAGKKLHYRDTETEKEIEVEFFAGVLGYSQLGFACAVASQSSEDFVLATKRMLQYYGGSPKAIVTDNLKSSVIKASRYEPEIAQTFSDFCNHYQMACLPTRVAKPKDKALVEGLIRILYSRIYAPLRNRTFYSLNEINTAIAELLEVHNDMAFTRRPESRRQVFEQQEKSLLQTLPGTVFEVKHYRKATVQKNSHIVLGEDKHYYSVPMRYIGRKVTVIYTAEEVNIFYEGERVAYHQRNRRPNKYTTVADHLPSQHRYVLGLTPGQFIDWGKSIHEDVSLYVDKLIARKNHPEQAYKSCQGLQSLSRKLGKDRLVNACQLGLELKVYSYMFIKNVMENKQNHSETPMTVLPLHENIRGPQAYQ